MESSPTAPSQRTVSTGMPCWSAATHPWPGPTAGGARTSSASPFRGPPRTCFRWMSSALFVFNPAMPAAAIQEQIDKAYAIQKNSQFGPARYALLFEPGEYKVDVPVGYYTQVLGLGASPAAAPI